MTVVIHKQKIPVFQNVTDRIELELPPFAKILKISRQFPHDPSPYVWYICNPDLPATEKVIIQVVGTGHTMAKPPGEYLGTEIFHDGQLVLHFFRADT